MGVIISKAQELTGTVEKSCCHLSNLSGAKYYSFIY